ncbi:MAG: hypothetical protein Q4A30_01610, partial [Candidatus Saccharibacteria bacterium]|nr:hypothetical protein [Candidatus Saccharibacteria bacterium]
QSSDNGDEGVEQSFGSTGAQGEGQRAGMGNNPTGAGEWLVMPENRERALRNLEKKQGWLRKFKYNFKKIGLFVATILAVGAVTGTTLSDNSQARNVKTESVDGSLMNELKTEANGQEGELDLDSEYGEQGESSMVNFEHNGFTMEAKINKHKGGYDERTDPYFAKKRPDRKTAFTPFAYNPEDPEPVRLTNMVEGNINNISKSYMNLSLWSTMMNSLDDTGNLPSMKDVNDFSIKLKEMGESGQTGEYDEQANKIATYFENFFKEGGRVETGTIEANKPYASLYISQNEGDGQLEMGFDDYVTHDHASEYVKFFDKDGKDILNEGPLKDVIVSIMNSASKSGAVFSGQYEIVWSAGCGQFCVFYESDLTVNIKPNPDDDDGGGGNNGGGGGGGKKREDDGGGDKHEDDDGGGDK